MFRRRNCRDSEDCRGFPLEFGADLSREIVLVLVDLSGEIVLVLYPLASVW